MSILMVTVSRWLFHARRSRARDEIRKIDKVLVYTPVQCWPRRQPPRGRTGTLANLDLSATVGHCRPPGMSALTLPTDPNPHNLILGGSELGVASAVSGPACCAHAHVQ